MRTRTVSWCEGRILETLGKAKKNPISLALCAMALNFEVRNHQEQQNYDLALYNLLKKGIVKEDCDEKGFKVFKLAA